MKKIINYIILIEMFLLGLPIAFGVNATASVYDLTNSSMTDDVFGFVKSVNDLTGQTFMSGILLVSFIILFVGFRDKGTEDALLGAGFITAVITILFTALNLVPRWISFLILVPFAAFFVYRLIKG